MIWRRLVLGYFWLCGAAFGLVMASRAAYYSGVPLPDVLGRVIEGLLQSHVLGFRRMLPSLVAQAIGLLLLLLVFAFWRRPFCDRSKRPFALRPWVCALAATGFLIHHYAFDADPLLAKVCWSSLALLMLGTVRIRCARPHVGRQRGAFAGGALTVAAGFWAAPTPVTTVAVVFWALWLAIVVLWVSRGLGARDALVLAMGMVPVAAFVIPASLVVAVPGLHEFPGEVVEDKGYAYSYCEFPETHTLFVAVPVGQTGDLQQLRSGYVAEYDTRDYSKRGEHRFFDDGFHGGLRQLLCMDDVVQVTMNLVYLDGNTHASNVFEFRADDPGDYVTSIWDKDLRGGRGWDLLGHTASYDAAADAVFFTSEWSRTVYRLDRTTGRLDRGAGKVLPRKKPAPTDNFGFFVRAESLSAKRRTLYLSEWLDGSRIFELDVDSGKLLRTFETRDTGAFGLAVDDQYGRLFASGMWGLNVFDLESGEIVHRQRLGPGGRTATVDTHHDLVFVPTTFGGHVWVLDRVTLRGLGRLTTGIGGRPTYLSLDGRAFFASDHNKTYRWDAAALARRFDGDR